MTEGAGGGSVQGYNAQIAVTDDHLILGVHVSRDANDTHQRLVTHPGQLRWQTEPACWITSRTRPLTTHAAMW